MIDFTPLPQENVTGVDKQNRKVSVPCPVMISIQHPHAQLSL